MAGVELSDSSGKSLQNLRDSISRYHKLPSIPDRDELQAVLIALNDTLAAEDAPTRPHDSGDMPGGVVVLDPSIPTVVLPDLHARPGLISAALGHVLDPQRHPGETVLDALTSGSAQLVCVGDYFHGEGRVRLRWRQAMAEFANEFRTHDAMDREMRESLSVLMMLGALKTASPRLVHLLKGNHENVANESRAGNRPFGKYAYEGAMVFDYISRIYDDRILAGIYYVEKRLPLLAIGSHFLVSHAEPQRLFSRQEVVEYRNHDDVVYGLTWTDDDQAQPDAVELMLHHYIGSDHVTGALYFGGHRPVSGVFNLRASGQYVQIHNPSKYIMAVLPADLSPVPDRDIFEIGVPEDEQDGTSTR